MPKHLGILELNHFSGDKALLDGVASTYIIMGTTMDHGVDWSSGKDDALMIMSLWWNANFWLYLTQVSPGA